MRVLVTGGTGFVGSQLVAALVSRGDQVRVLRRANSSLLALEGLPNIEHVIGDILDLEAVAQAVTGCDLVFHVAALSSYWRAQREQIYRINVDGTRTVLEACLQARVPRVVVTSSVGAIGIRPDGRPADETTHFDRASANLAYADSKHRAEAVAQRLVKLGLDAVIVNPAAVFGPGDHYQISGSMIVEFARRRLPAVPAGGLCVVDIDAVVQGHIAAAERGRTGERYILGGENLAHRADRGHDLRGGRSNATALDTPGLGFAAGSRGHRRIQPDQPETARTQRRSDAFERGELLFRLKQSRARAGLSDAPVSRCSGTGICMVQDSRLYHVT